MLVTNNYSWQENHWIKEIHGNPHGNPRKSTRKSTEDVLFFPMGVHLLVIDNCKDDISQTIKQSKINILIYWLKQRFNFSPVPTHEHKNHLCSQLSTKNNADTLIAEKKQQTKTGMTSHWSLPSHDSFSAINALLSSKSLSAPVNTCAPPATCKTLQVGDAFSEPTRLHRLLLDLRSLTLFCPKKKWNSTWIKEEHHKGEKYYNRTLRDLKIALVRSS